ncbi:MAG: mechanosensitive ion channel family protein [Gloeomargarita sp. SKYB31]|nr:mechanosensitive ion channel family protein [Gloeomargarita sp. SKYB31]
MNRRRWLLFTFGTCAAGLVIGSGLVGHAQLPLPQPTPSHLPPVGVTRYGNIEVTDVVFDGQVLFTIASPTVRDRHNPGVLMPVELRAELIKANLRRIIAPYIQNPLAQQDPQVMIAVAMLNNEVVLLGRSRLQQQHITIMTVTQWDASFNGIPASTLAEQWRAIIQTRLQEAIRQRTPNALLQQLIQALKILALVIAVSLLLLGLQRLVRRRQSQLHLQIAQEQSNPSSIPTLPLIQLHFSYTQRYRLVAFIGYLLVWVQLAIWLAGLAHILAIFPQTRGVAMDILRLPIIWLAVWFVTGLAGKIADFLIDRLQKVWESYDLFDAKELTRRSLRISTTIQTLRGVKTAVIYIVRAGYILNTIGVPVSSLFAIGGLVALAISLGSQNVIKDIINGLLILWEDQFGIGDVVQIDEYTGAVESMSLRITQLRNSEGCLITIPNSSIVKVSNLTRLWSRVNFEILVDCQTDPTQALQVLKQVTQAFYADPEWRQVLLEFPEVLGIDAARHDGLLLRVWIKTQPGHQWAVEREFRRRVVQALAANGIALGRPHQVFEHGPTGS